MESNQEQGATIADMVNLLITKIEDATANNENLLANNGWRVLYNELYGMCDNVQKARLGLVSDIAEKSAVLRNAQARADALHAKILGGVVDSKSVDPPQTLDFDAFTRLRQSLDAGAIGDLHRQVYGAVPSTDEYKKSLITEAAKYFSGGLVGSNDIE